MVLIYLDCYDAEQKSNDDASNDCSVVTRHSYQVSASDETAWNTKGFGNKKNEGTMNSNKNDPILENGEIVVIVSNRNDKNDTRGRRLNNTKTHKKKRRSASASSSKKLIVTKNQNILVSSSSNNGSNRSLPTNLPTIEERLNDDDTEGDASSRPFNQNLNSKDTFSVRKSSSKNIDKASDYETCLRRAQEYRETIRETKMPKTSPVVVGSKLTTSGANCSVSSSPISLTTTISSSSIGAKDNTGKNLHGDGQLNNSRDMKTKTYHNNETQTRLHTVAPVAQLPKSPLPRTTSSSSTATTLRSTKPTSISSAYKPKVETSNYKTHAGISNDPEAGLHEVELYDDDFTGSSPKGIDGIGRFSRTSKDRRTCSYLFYVIICLVIAFTCIAAAVIVSRLSIKVPHKDANDMNTTISNNSSGANITSNANIVAPNASFETLYINAGNNYTDPVHNRSWVSDSFYLSPEMENNSMLYSGCANQPTQQKQGQFDNDGSDIVNGLWADSIFCSERWFESNVATYEVPVLDDVAINYTVRLYFNELFYKTRNERLFDIFIEGQMIVSNFDIYHEAGGRRSTVVVVEISPTVVLDGAITIVLHSIKNAPKLTAMEISSFENAFQSNTSSSSYEGFSHSITTISTSWDTKMDSPGNN